MAARRGINQLLSMKLHFKSSLKESLAINVSDPHAYWEDYKMDNVKCNTGQIQFLQGSRHQKRMGVFINSCFAHCQSERQNTWLGSNSPAIRLRSKQQDLFNAMGSMYASVMFLGISNASSVQPMVSVERAVFYRERAAGMYSALPYAFGQVGIEIPYVLIQAIIYGIIVYSMIGFEWTVAKFFWYLFFMFFTFLYFTYYGMMAVGLTPNYNIASIVSSAFYGLWNLFSGFIIPQPRMHVWWRWYS